MSEEPGTDGEARAETVYLSWGSTGRVAAFRHALLEADDAGRAVVYLAVLDDAHFGDIDENLLDLASEELRWLLDAQVDLARTQVGRPEADVTVLIRAGEVIDEVAEVLDALAAGDDAGAGLELVLGAPIPEIVGRSVPDLIEQLERRTGVPVRIIEG